MVGVDQPHGNFDTGVAGVPDDDSEPGLYLYFETGTPTASVLETVDKSSARVARRRITIGDNRTCSVNLLFTATYGKVFGISGVGRLSAKKVGSGVDSLQLGEPEGQ